MTTKIFSLLKRSINPSSSTFERAATFRFPWAVQALHFNGWGKAEEVSWEKPYVLCGGQYDGDELPNQVTPTALPSEERTHTTPHTLPTARASGWRTWAHDGGWC